MDINDEYILKLKRVPPQIAARYLGMSDNILYEGLKNGDFPFGTATKGTKGRWEYDIRPQALVNYNHSGHINMDELANTIVNRVLAALNTINQEAI